MKYLDLEGLSFFLSELKNKYLNIFNDYLNHISGGSKITSLENIPITKRLVNVDISTNSQFSIQGNLLPYGKYLHILIKNTSNNQIVVSLPTAAPYVQVNTDVLSIPAGKIGEINALSDGINIYLRAV